MLLEGYEQINSDRKVRAGRGIGRLSLISRSGTESADRRNFTRNDAPLPALNFDGIGQMHSTGYLGPHFNGLSLRKVSRYNRRLSPV
jgi:hypothetical protein